MVEKLMENPMSVNELAELLDQEQSMISHNLKPLLRCKFIFGKRQGKKHIYYANQETIGALLLIISNHTKKFCPESGNRLTEEKTIGN